MNRHETTPPPDLSPYYRLWARQLLAEFELINHQYGLGLAPPVIEIAHTAKQLGSWQATTRTIRISARLITTSSWDVTCLILKHEMAHQICSELFAHATGNHGPVFHRACDLLDLPAHYRHASADLSDQTTEPPAFDLQTAKARQFIHRVGKLLALATSANQHEAALAMEKASRLITRHNLQQLLEDTRSQFTSHIIHTHSQRLETWQRKICVILLQFFHVRVVTADLYDPLRDTHYKTIELFGRQENVTIAEYCYAFLAGKIASLWQENRIRIGGKGIRSKNSYYLGLLQGLHDKLQGQKTAITPPVPDQSPATTQTATSLTVLIEAEAAALNRFVGRRFPGLRKRSGGRILIHGETYEQGRTDGRQIVLHKGVSGQGGQPGLLIEKAP